MFLRVAWIVAVAWAVMVIAPSGVRGAEIPGRINYQGMLADASGEPLPGEHTVVFRIFDADAGGTELWSETQPVVADTSGVFSAVLGSVDSIDAGFDGLRWLEVAVDGETLTPRRELVSVPYAFQAANAHMVAGLRADAFADSAHSHHSLDAADGDPAGALFVDADGNVGVGTETPAVKLDVAGTAEVDGFTMTPGAHEGHVLTSDAAGAGTWHAPQALPDADWVLSGSNMYSAVPGNVGIGKVNPTHKLDVFENSGANGSIAVFGANLAASGHNTCGVYGTTSTLDQTYPGAGVQGVAVGAAGVSSGVLGVAEGDEGKGVQAVALHTSGSNMALYAETKSPNGFAGYFTGGRSYFQGKVSIGTISPGAKLFVVETSGDLGAAAVYGVSTSPTAQGALGVIGSVATADSTVECAGVYGTATNSLGKAKGVSGKSSAASGIGVFAGAIHSTGRNYGLWAYTNSPNGYAGYFTGSRNYFEGKVGIGIDQPDNLLHVSGIGDVSGGVAGYGEVVGHFRTSVGHTAIAVDAAGGDLDAIIYLGKQGNAVWDLRNDSDAGNKFQLRYQGGTAQNKPYLTVSNYGDVLIGTTPLTAKLAVVDSVAREGAILAVNRMSADGVGAVFVGNNAAQWTDMNGCGLAASGNKWGILAVSSKTTLEAGAVHGVLVDGSAPTAQARLCYRSAAGTLYKVHGDGLSATTVATSAGKRTLVCPESPEAWFEDYGSGQIESGACHVELDPIFLDCITVSETHPLKVFVQLTSPLEQQYYVKKSATGFDVVVTGAGAGAAAAAFDYKVVGKWKGYENLRFERAPEDVGAVRLSSREGE
jgi:hypothetical protein